MGRIQVTYPFTFGSESGNHPASELDDNFLAIPNTGTLTIRAQQLGGADYNVVENDEYSFFVAKGIVDFKIIPPVAPPIGFSFFVSNETTQEAVQIVLTLLCTTVFVGNVSYTNPTLVGDFPPYFFNVKGGLVQFDGNNYFFYPLFFASSGGGAVKQATVVVNSGDTGVTITHGFNQAGLSVVLLPQWNTQIYQTAQSNTQVTFAFSNPVPLVSPPTLSLTYLVFFP